MTGPEGPNFNTCLVISHAALGNTSNITVWHERVATSVPSTLMVGHDTSMEEGIVKEDPRHAEPDNPETSAREIDDVCGNVVSRIEDNV